MHAKRLNQLGLKAWWWLFSAYWQLWPVLFRLRYGRFAWLKEQVEFSATNHQAANSSPIMNTKVPAEDAFAKELLAMHEAVRLAARLHFLRADCLPRSIVLARGARRQGYTARVVIGIAKSSSSLASHAWVEVMLEQEWTMVGEPESVSHQFGRV